MSKLTAASHQRRVRLLAIQGCSTGLACVARLDDLAEFGQQCAELVKAFAPESLGPFTLDLCDDFTQGVAECFAAGRELDPFALVGSGERLALQVAEHLELSEKMVDGLAARPRARRELGGPKAVRPGPLEDREVSLVQIGEPALPESLQLPVAQLLPGDAQQRSHQRRPEFELHGQTVK